MKNERTKRLLSSVIPCSPLEKAGARVSDTLVGMNGIAISSFDDFVAYSERNPMTGVTVDLIRGNQFISLFIPKEEDE